MRDELEMEASPAIGTLREGALHAQIKEWYRRPGDELEKRHSGFVIDLVRGDLLVEIQTGGFAPLKRKLEILTREHSVRIVTPVAVERRIIRISGSGEIVSCRRSPRRPSFFTGWQATCPRIQVRCSAGRSCFPYSCFRLCSLHACANRPATRFCCSSHIC